MRRTLAALFTLALLLPATLLRAEVQPDERWYVVEMQGQRSGWMRESVAPDGENIRSEMQMHLEFGRGAMRGSAGIETAFVETPDGAPVRMSMTQRLGDVPSTTTFVFHEDSVEITADNAGQTFTQTIPEGVDPAWLTPHRAALDLETRLAAGEKEITQVAITPLTGVAPVETTMRIEGEETIEVLGRRVPALRTTITTSILPGSDSVQHISPDGRILRTVQKMGALELVVIAADKQLALGELDPPEIMASTFVKPVGEPIANPRRASKAVYKLTTSNDARVPAFVGGAQTADIEEGALLVTVDTARQDRAPAKPEHSASTSMLASDDPVVVQLARRAVKDAGKNPEDKANAMRRFVHEFISAKHLGVGYASASEVARTAEGDCTEHAVLLAAMLRADGIPSRVMSGLVYTQAFAGAQDVFGYHAWTQAHVRGRWIDLDATLRDTPFDAAHIALGASAMEDGELVNALVDVAPVLGTLQIEVESIK